MLNKMEKRQRHNHGPWQCAEDTSSLPCLFVLLFFFSFSEVFFIRMSCLQSFIAAIEDEKCFMHSAISILKAKALRTILEMQKVRSIFTYSWRSEEKKRVLEQIRVIAGEASSPAVVSHLRTWPLMTVWGAVPVHTACSWHTQQYRVFSIDFWVIIKWLTHLTYNPRHRVCPPVITAELFGAGPCTVSGLEWLTLTAQPCPNVSLLL